ncbi:GNAT family N-acetyltransferase [Nocardioidaceae bacterium]|nr:GNAT family N-acetyltransferase [Nocardioidaceae bacterium]
MPLSDRAWSDRASVETLLLRPATPADLPQVADVLVASRAAASPSMPPFARPVEEVREATAALDLTDGREVWVADRDGAVVGFAELRQDWLDDLYVHPDHAGTGVGTALVDCVRGLRPGGVSLWCFATNAPARAFYAARGFVELETTDGSANEEGVPDVRLVWAGADPVWWLRREIDDVDTHLARLVAQRVALTAAVQPHKPVPGRAGRDPEREAAIAARMVEVAPGVDAAAYARVVDLLVDLGLEQFERTAGGS